MTIDLDAIKARLAAACPGPWTGMTVKRFIDGDCLAIVREHPEGSHKSEKGTTLTIAATLLPQYGDNDTAAMLLHSRADMDALVAEVERLRAEVAASEARRLQLLDDAGGLENECRELRIAVDRLKANHDGLVTTTMEREEFLCAAVEEESRGRCDDRNAVVKYLRVCGHDEAADAISLCGHPLYLCLPAVYTRP